MKNFDRYDEDAFKGIELIHVNLDGLNMSKLHESKRIGIVGYGYVGKAVEKYFADHYQLWVYDPPYVEANQLDGVEEKHMGQSINFTQEKENITSCDLVVVCVPTPEGADGDVDLSLIDETFEWLNAPLILIKSTVPPGTTAQLVAGERTGKWIGRNICFSPEYIGEGGYEVPYWKGYPHPTDMKKHSFHIFGGELATGAAISQFFMKVSGPDCQYRLTDSTTAELVKYMFNSWGATKVTFCNEFYNIAETLGVNYTNLRELLLLDKRMEPMHTAVFEDKRGFGGKCFPKDVKGIVRHAEKHGYAPELLKEVLKSNARIKKPHEGKH